MKCVSEIAQDYLSPTTFRINISPIWKISFLNYRIAPHIKSLNDGNVLRVLCNQVGLKLRQPVQLGSDGRNVALVKKFRTP